VKNANAPADALGMGDIPQTPLGAGPELDHDLLTGLPNARAWSHLVAEHRRRHPDRSWLAVVRVDDFAAFASTSGGAAADLLLVDAAAAWGAALRGGDVIARLDGADFGCLVRATELMSAFAVVARLRAGLPAGHTLSAAIVHPDAHEAPLAVTARARDALGHAGARGVNRVAVLLPEAEAA